MYKQTFQQRIAMIVLLALLFCCWGNVALAEEAPSFAENISVATSDNMQSIDENYTIMDQGYRQNWSIKQMDIDRLEYK